VLGVYNELNEYYGRSRIPKYSFIRQLKELDKDSPISIIAPFKGRIMERLVTTGEIVDASTKLFKLVDLSTVWVWVNIPEKDLARVSKGQLISITPNAYPERVFNGKITYVSDSVSPATRTVKIRAELPNSEGILKPEMFAAVTIKGKGHGQSPVIPESAVQREGENIIVFVEKSLPEEREKIFEKRKVSIGNVVNGYHQVLSGLTEGERIVVKGTFTLKSEGLKGLMQEE
jgi:RND family efflux transporter MFP subunit